jgi:hypothetical protein
VSDKFTYRVEFENGGKFSDGLRCECDQALAYAAYQRMRGCRKTKVWRQYKYRDELGATVTNETLIEEWPFK